jgi:hypothetical protein
MNSNALWPAIESGNIGEIRRLADEGVPVSAPDTSRPDRWTPLHFAASVPASAAAGLLVELGADIDARAAHGGTPLLLAVLNSARDRGACAVELIARGADVWAANGLGITPLYVADDLMDAAPAMTEAFEHAASDRRASWHRDAGSSLVTAASSGTGADIIAAAEAEDDVDVRDATGRTPLMIVTLRSLTASWNRDGLAQLDADAAAGAIAALLAAGASPLSPNDAGASALAIAEDFEAPVAVLSILRSAS